MKRETISIRLDEELAPLLAEACKHSGQTRSEIVREALKKHFAQLRFKSLRRRVLPYAEARGYLTDEDVFDDVS